MHPGGTSVYLVGEGEMVLVDSGDGSEEAIQKVLSFLESLGSPRLSHIFITHSHFDHSGGVGRIAAETGALVRGHPLAEAQLAPNLGSARFSPLAEGETLQSGSLLFQAFHTPGHSRDSLCLLMREGTVLFTGDTILGMGTVTIRDLPIYMDSLQKLLALHPRWICPGHGPVVNGGTEKIREYIEHRLMRERQILAALEEGPKTSWELVLQIYSDVDPRLHRAAEGNVLTHLAKLQAEGRVATASQGPPLRYHLTG